MSYQELLDIQARVSLLCPEPSDTPIPTPFDVALAAGLATMGVPSMPLGETASTTSTSAITITPSTSSLEEEHGSPQVIEDTAAP